MKLFKEYRGLRREMYILFIGRVMTNLGSMVWPMFTLILNQKLGLSAGKIAVYMMLFTILSLPVSLLGGKLADRFNKKNIIVVCDLVSIAAYLYCGFVPISIGSILVFAAASLFQSVEWPSYDALVSDFTTSADRERAFSLQYLGANLGLVLAPTIGGYLFNDYLNLAFIINGISIATSTILIFFLIKDVSREKDTSAAAMYEAEIDSSISVFSVIAKNRVALMYILATALGEAVYGMYSYLLPLDMSRVHGDAGPALFGTVSSVNCITVVACTAAITRIFRRLKDTDKMLCGEILVLAGYVVMLSFIRSPLLCYAGMAVFTFGEIFNATSASPFISRRIPASHRGRISSVSGVFCQMLSAGTKLVIGNVYDRSGPAEAWSSIFIIGAVSMAALLVMKAMDRKDFSALYELRKDEE